MERLVYVPTSPYRVKAKRKGRRQSRFANNYQNIRNIMSKIHEQGSVNYRCIKVQEKPVETFDDNVNARSWRDNLEFFDEKNECEEQLDMRRYNSFL